LDVQFASGNELKYRILSLWLLPLHKALLLIAFNPWLILILVLAIIPHFQGESYFNNYALPQAAGTQKRTDYLCYLSCDETAKEVKRLWVIGFYHWSF
jgi:hypothetical protein